MVEDLSGKAVFITGSSTGIGAAAAMGFARYGARVAVHFNASQAEGERVAGEIKRIGGDAALFQGDLTRVEDLNRVVGEVLRHFGRIDVLINNAGGMLGRKPLLEITDEHYERVMRLNCWSVLATTRAVVPAFRRQGGGNIINVSSIAARHGGGGGAVLYAAAKGFVSTFTRGMARELVKDRVRVNAVSPGVIATPFHDRYSTAEQLAAMRTTIPMDRIGTAEDCVGTFLWLASDSLSGYVTGQVIEVNGGQYMA
jgi:3-oxoacyl-[acyl-carrier protein] reductase